MFLQEIVQGIMCVHNKCGVEQVIDIEGGKVMVTTCVQEAKVVKTDSKCEGSKVCWKSEVNPLRLSKKD